MALSTQQLLLLNNLLYADGISFDGNSPQSSVQGKTIGEIIQSINPKSCADSFTTEAEWNAMINQIKSDPQLMNVQAVRPYQDYSTGDKGCLFVDPSSNEAVVAFCGTAGGEWKDNFIAGAKMGDSYISPQQQKALDYVESLDLSGYDTVTTTGHSKGGNKAKICALLSGDVDRCVSFDGQGFSDEFMEHYADQIAQNQGKIQNHNADYDYVNLLLNDVGETHFYESPNVENDFIRNHSPAALFDSNCNMTATSRPAEMAALDRFLNTYLRSMDPGQKADSLDFAGEVFSSLLGNNKRDVMDILLSSQYTDEASYLIAYLVTYEHETGEITGALSGLLDELGMGKFKDLVSGASALMENDIAFGALKGIAKLGDDIPGWLLNWARKQFKIPLTEAQLRQLLLIIAQAGEQMGEIDIERGSGEDITVSSDGGSSPGPLNWGSLLAELNELLEAIGGEGLYIFVHFQELLNTVQMLERAVEDYQHALRIVENAANDLGAKWMGAARDAFMIHQQNMDTGCHLMASVLQSCAGCMRSLVAHYQGTEDTVTGIMRG